MVSPFKPSKDPITGDVVSFSERMSLLAQSTVRRWSVTFIHIGFSLFWWIRFWNHGFSDPVNMWMAMYSLIAVVNENVLGIGQSSQNRRDAVLLRTMYQILSKMSLTETAVQSEVDEVKSDIEKLLGSK